MAFARDVDLLRYEPEVFAQVRWAGQRIGRVGTGSLVDTELRTDVLDQGVADAGYVVLVDGVAYEIKSITFGGYAVQRIRQIDGGQADPSGTITDARVEGYSFRPQIQAAHRQLMRLIGVEPEDAPRVVANTDPVLELECLSALHIIFAGAAAMSADLGGLERKAEAYRTRLRRARERAVVPLDLDGDGVAEVRRRFAVMHLARG